MAKGRAAYKGFKKVSGAKLGARAIRVYTCTRCGTQQLPGKRPESCISCGNLAFDMFHSVGEAGRCATLQMLEKAGKISNLRRQVPFDLMAARQLQGRTVAVKIGTYVADYTYDRDGENVIEDFKSSGVIDPLAAWKLKHMEAMGKPVTIST